MEPSLIQPDPEDALCTTCELPYTDRAWAAGCEEHTEFWCETGDPGR